MQINLEASEQHLVQAYSDKKIQINSIIYESSVIVSKEEIITNLVIHKLEDVAERYFNVLLKFKPDVILIGQDKYSQLPPLSLIALFSQQGIGLESLSLGAACRTHNVLLNEHRSVVSVFIL